MKNKKIVFLFAVCFTFQDLKDIECKTWCKMNSYDSGVYTKTFCWCADKVPQERIDQKRVNVPVTKRKPNTQIIPFNIPIPEITKLPWED